MEDTQPYISFILPCYNEEKNLRVVMDQLLGVLQELPWDWELIIVEDASTDGTQEVVRQQAARDLRIRAIYHQQNAGLVGAIKTGQENARGQYAMYLMADQEFDSREIPLYISKIEKGADLVVGIRWQRDAYSLSRLLLSVVYIFILNFLYRFRCNDYNWIRIWPTDFHRQAPIESKSLFFLAETILKASDLGYKIVEIPSNHRGRPWGKSTSSNFFVMLHALMEAIIYRFKRKSVAARLKATHHPVRRQRETLPQESTSLSI
ncbi:MAG: glycosyltransferase family 2 protein [Candidatus Omnitrophica bacterium]|nr:glycosyltransferase family 2 protein [Candidatus Omnitrophota bacterium]